jgi:hypothetical protein
MPNLGRSEMKLANSDRMWAKGIGAMDSEIVYVRFGSKADIGQGRVDVRFTPKSGHRQAHHKAVLL